MSEMSYYDMNKCLCKELKCEFEKFEHDKNAETLKGIKDIIESMCGLMELEAGGAMREYLEDNGEFRQKYNNVPYSIYNAARPYPMTTPPYYGGEYGEYGMMDAGDGRYMNRGDRGRNGEYMEDGRGMYNRGRSRDSRGRYNEGREGYGIYNMAHMKEGETPKKLTEHEKQEWLDSMQNSDGTRGETFSKEECVAIAKKVGAKFDEYSEQDFCLALNAVYSDFCDALTKADPKVAENPMTYGYLAMAWLDDDDSYPPEERLARYWHYMVKH